MPVSPRPPTLRAMGADEPPTSVLVNGELCRLLRVLKHDSWAATAIYLARSGPLICKFNRQQSILGMPMLWLGRLLAWRERSLLLHLHDLPNVPHWAGSVVQHGSVLPNVVARRFIAGHTLTRRETLPDEYFASLETLLAELHRRGIAYNDLNKRENILVGDDGLPYLFDFQISLTLPPLLRRLPPFDWLLRLLQASDRYHLQKHVRRCCPQRVQAPVQLPWWIRLHRLVAVPVREGRRRLLVALRVRSGVGRVTSEVFAEEAFRPTARLHAEPDRAAVETPPRRRAA